MNKKTILVSGLILMSLLLASCGQIEKKDQDTEKTNNKIELSKNEKEAFSTNTVNNPIEGINKVDEQKQIVAEKFKNREPEEVLVLTDKDNSYLNKIINPKLAETGKLMKQNLKFIDDDNIVGKELLKVVKEARGENYSFPFFFYEENTKIIDTTKIPKEYLINAEFDGKKYIALVEPMMTQLPKFIIHLDKNDKELFDKYTITKNTVDDNSNIEIIVVTDPLCPHCAQAYNDPVNKNVLGKYNTKILTLGLLSEQSANLARYAQTHLDKEVLANLFNNQDKLLVVNTKFQALKNKIIGDYQKAHPEATKMTLTDADKAEITKVNDEMISLLESFDEDKSIKETIQPPLTPEDQKIITMKFGIYGTPTMFVHDKKKDELYLIPNYNYLPYIIKAIKGEKIQDGEIKKELDKKDIK